MSGFEYLDADGLVALASRLLGDPPAIRDAGLLGATAARPQATVSGSGGYPDVWSKAAALLHSVVKNHALLDGNKRLGWLATAVLLEPNGVAVNGIPNEEVYRFVMSVAAGRDDVGHLAEQLRRLRRQLSRRVCVHVAVWLRFEDRIGVARRRPMGMTVRRTTEEPSA